LWADQVEGLGIDHRLNLVVADVFEDQNVDLPPSL
jgi:hypothetical protein